MSTPEHHPALQALIDLVVAAVPDDWSRASLVIGFRSEVATDVHLHYSRGADGLRIEVDRPIQVSLALARSAREVRSELEQAGNPECRALTLVLTDDGDSALEVEY